MANTFTEAEQTYIYNNLHYGWTAETRIKIDGKNWMITTAGMPILATIQYLPPQTMGYCLKALCLLCLLKWKNGREKKPNKNRYLANH
jgi:hypothetical protein